MDVLTDVLATCGLEATLLARQSLRPPWAVRFPCEKSLGFHVVTRGEAWLRSNRLPAPVLLRKGDIALLARGFDHEIATGADVPVNQTVTPADAEVAPEPTDPLSDAGLTPVAWCISLRDRPCTRCSGTSRTASCSAGTA